MTIQPDFEELLRLLEKHEADYMIVGGYEVARSHRVRGRYGKVEVNFIGRLDLIQNKKATKRARDQVDVEVLLAGNDSVEAQERLDGYE